MVSEVKRVWAAHTYDLCHQLQLAMAMHVIHGQLSACMWAMWARHGIAIGHVQHRGILAT